VRNAEKGFVVIVNRGTVHRAPAEVWARIGGFFDLHRFLDVVCTPVAGAGGIGSVRRIGEAIVEPMVGATALSYTYAQTEGPMARHAYHGCVECRPSGDGSEVTYTLVYDQTGIESERRLAEQDRLRARFRGALEAMLRHAQG
jgi:hypothetical protein